MLTGDTGSGVDPIQAQTLEEAEQLIAQQAVYSHAGQLDSSLIVTGLNTTSLDGRTTVNFGLTVQSLDRTVLLSGFPTTSSNPLNHNRWDIELDNGYVRFMEHQTGRFIGTARQLQVGDQVEVLIDYDDQADQIAIYLDDQLEAQSTVDQSLNTGLDVTVNGRPDGSMANANAIEDLYIYDDLSDEERDVLLGNLAAAEATTAQLTIEEKLNFLTPIYQQTGGATNQPIATGIDTSNLTGRTTFSFTLTATANARSVILSGFPDGPGNPLEANRWDVEWENGQLKFMNHQAGQYITTPRVVSIGETVDVIVDFNDDSDTVSLYLDGDHQVTAAVTQSLHMDQDLAVNSRLDGSLPNANPIDNLRVYAHRFSDLQPDAVVEAGEWKTNLYRREAERLDVEIHAMQVAEPFLDGIDSALTMVDDVHKLQDQLQAMHDAMTADLESVVDDPVMTLAYSQAFAPIEAEMPYLEAHLSTLEQNCMAMVEQRIDGPSLSIVQTSVTQVYFHVVSDLDSSHVVVTGGGPMSGYTLHHAGGTQHTFGMVVTSDVTEQTKMVQLYDQEGGTMLDEIELVYSIANDEVHYALASNADRWDPEQYVRGRAAMQAHDDGADMMAAAASAVDSADGGNFASLDQTHHDLWTESQEWHGWQPSRPGVDLGYFTALAKRHGLFMDTDNSLSRFVQMHPYLVDPDAYRQYIIDQSQILNGGVADGFQWTDILNSGLADMMERFNTALADHQAVLLDHVLPGALRVLEKIEAGEAYESTPEWNNLELALYQLGSVFSEVPTNGHGAFYTPPTIDRLLEIAMPMFAGDMDIKLEWHDEDMEQMASEYQSMQDHLRNLDADRVADSEQLSIHRTPPADQVQGDYFAHYSESEVSNFLWEEGVSTVQLQSDYTLFYNVFDSLIIASEEVLQTRAEYWTNYLHEEAAYFEEAADGVDRSTVAGQLRARLLLDKASLRYALADLMNVVVAVYPDNLPDATIDVAVATFGVLRLPAYLQGTPKLVEFLDLFADIDSYWEEHDPSH